MKVKYVGMICITVFVCVVAITLLAGESWIIGRKKYKENSGARKIYIVRFTEPSQSAKSLIGLRRALEMIAYTLPAHGYRVHINFLCTYIHTLRGNVVLRALVDCSTVILRYKAHVSARNLYLRSINIFHRQSVVANARVGLSDRLALSCENSTALVIVGLHGFVDVHYTSGATTMCSERADALDAVFIGTNHLSSKPIYIDVEADVLILQFAAATSLL